MSNQIKPFICMTGIIAVCGMFGFFVSSKMDERSAIATQVDAVELAARQPTRSTTPTIAPKKYTEKMAIYNECVDNAKSQKQHDQCELDQAGRARQMFDNGELN
jgi:hypothetical protein